MNELQRKNARCNNVVFFRQPISICEMTPAIATDVTVVSSVTLVHPAKVLDEMRCMDSRVDPSNSISQNPGSLIKRKRKGLPEP